MIDEALLELLTPTIRAIVREEVAAAVRAEVERLAPRQRWLSVEQAAHALGISEPALRQRIRRGQAPAKRLDGRLYVDMDEHDRRLDALP